MYQNIDKSEKIYLYDVYKEAYVIMFPTFLDALKFLAANSVKIDWCHEERNQYLDHINMGNDVEVFFKHGNFVDNDGMMRYYTERNLIQRQYIFVDGLNRIIDFRKFQKEILHLRDIGDTKFESFPKKKRKFKWFFNDIPYEYRRDPVPHRGKRSGSKAYRMPKVHNLFKQVVDEEDKKYVRAKRNRNNLPNVYWDDPPLRSRWNSRSWKDCTKKSHQWE